MPASQADQHFRLFLAPRWRLAGAMHRTSPLRVHPCGPVRALGKVRCQTLAATGARTQPPLYLNPGAAAVRGGCRLRRPSPGRAPAGPPARVRLPLGAARNASVRRLPSGAPTGGSSPPESCQDFGPKTRCLGPFAEVGAARPLCRTLPSPARRLTVARAARDVRMPWIRRSWGIPECLRSSGSRTHSVPDRRVESPRSFPGLRLWL